MHSRDRPEACWKTKPSWFLVAEEDRMINPETQYFMAGRMGAKVRAHAVDHTPLVTAPEQVVDVILEAAGCYDVTKKKNQHERKSVMTESRLSHQ